MRKFYILLPVFILLTSFFAMANGPVWGVYTNYGDVKYIYEKNNKVLVATLGGLAVHDRISKENKFYTKSSGIPSNTVEVVKTDEVDNIWIGTYDAGIAYQDGTTWKWFNTKNSPLPSDAVLALEIDNKGNKWVGTHKGLVKISPNNGWTIYTSATSGLKNDDVWSLCMDANGILWVGCANGLFSLKDSVWEDHTTKVGIYGVRGLSANTLGHVVASGVGGVYLFKNNGWQQLEDTSAGNPVHTSVYPSFDNENNVWVSTNSGLYKYNGQSWASASGNKTSITAMCLATDGSFWGAGKSGLLQYENQDWKTVATLSKSIPENNIRALASDKNGSIWSATNNTISRYKNNAWQIFYLSDEEMPLGQVQHIRTEKPGEVWFCTAKGLGKFDESTGKFIAYNMQNTSLPTNYIIDIAFENNIKWVLHEDGISLWNGSEWAHLGLPMQFDLNEMPTCGILVQGTYFWMGSSKGNIYRFDKTNSNWTRYSLEDETFAGGYVHDIVWDKKENLVWAGTWSGGASYFDGDKWNTSKIGDGKIVTALLTDGYGNIWSGTTLPAALTRLNNAEILKTFDAENSPLPLKSITSIITDENGMLWIGTSQGLFTYKEEGIILGMEQDNLSLESNNLKVYPSPANNNLYIDAEKNALVTLMDISGKTVYTAKAGSTTHVIDVKYFNQGLYMVKLETEDKVKTSKILITH